MEQHYSHKHGSPFQSLATVALSWWFRSHYRPSELLVRHNYYSMHGGLFIVYINYYCHGPNFNRIIQYIIMNDGCINLSGSIYFITQANIMQIIIMFTFETFFHNLRSEKAGPVTFEL